ncbi:hypothetical protein N865_12990 [Intrasporangium oryzae NRRL B-24470]|uniref:Hemerythrin-like domain-containing protein n=1 Tax=Intrasporangium oryzae NRRL B-24470 TaxID=1386089 RepID=W9G4M8_9MICO|nr:hemerythrin domain-containing protein [Intrasporangium oryzae]EWT00262.1 hypothetical protein N865_12990 [Intrasporangium oryzae NRRL B-24470]
MTASATALTDTREMLIVHSLFRRELRLAGSLVRGVQPGDTRSAQVAGDHLALVEHVLHHHHTTEDELLWPLLTERVADELHPVVGLMESQHTRVDRLLEEIAQARPVWAAAPTRAAGEALADRYDELYAGLVEHLDAEETRVLPLVSRCITPAEWARLSKAGQDSVPRKHRTLVVGMLLHDSGPEGEALLFGSAPAPVRAIVPRLGRRAYRQHALRVYGSLPPVTSTDLS